MALKKNLRKTWQNMAKNVFYDQKLDSNVSRTNSPLHLWTPMDGQTVGWIDLSS